MNPRTLPAGRGHDRLESPTTGLSQQGDNCRRFCGWGLGRGGGGTPLDGRNVTKRFQSILRNAKIPKHRFHDLRHTAATLLAVQGVHPKAIQSVLGWDQVSMVDRYAHFIDEMRKEAAAKMDAILKPVAVTLAVKPPTTKVC
jgi:integrase